MATISRTVSDEEARTIRARAQSERLTVSGSLRRQAVATVKTRNAIGRVRHPLTGASNFAGVEDLPPVAVGSTRKMLGDFRRGSASPFGV